MTAREQSSHGRVVIPVRFGASGVEQMNALCQEFGIGTRLRGVVTRTVQALGQAFAEDVGPITIAEILAANDLEKNSSTYKAYAENSKTISADAADGVHRMILGSPLLRDRSHGELEIRPADWAGAEAWVLKAALALPGSLVPVDIRRAFVRRGCAEMLVEMWDRLSSTGHEVSFISRDPGAVDALVEGSRQRRITWTSEVSKLWAPHPSVHSEWLHPTSADVLGVGDALAWTPSRVCHIRISGTRLLTAYGPSSSGRYYLHCPAVGSGVEEIREGLQRAVAILETPSPSLDGFPAQRLQVLQRNPKQYFAFTRIILLACFFSLWREQYASGEADCPGRGDTVTEAIRGGS